MDCTTARALLAFRRAGGPPELPPADLAALDGHLAGCPACDAAAGREARFDAAVAAAMAAVAVPPGLRAALHRRVAERRAADFRRTASRYAALAAAVLLAVGTGFGVYRTQRPAFDVDTLTLEASQSREANDQAAAVRGWLAAEGLPQTLPLEFDFRLHAFHGKERVFGRDVPVVVFQKVDHHGRVETLKLYLVRTDRFRVRGESSAQSFAGAQVVGEDPSGVVFVALFTSPTIDPFLARTVPSLT